MSGVRSATTDAGLIAISSRTVRADRDQPRGASSREVTRGTSPAPRGLMVFRKFDAGDGHRSVDAKGGDCQVRALATATSRTYADAWELLYAIQGERRACAFVLVEALRASDARLRVVRSFDFKAVRGKARMTGREFCRLHPRGRFILRMAHHVAAVKDGQVFDTWDSTSRCVYAAWEVEAVNVACDLACARGVCSTPERHR